MRPPSPRSESAASSRAPASRLLVLLLVGALAGGLFGVGVIATGLSASASLLTGFACLTALVAVSLPVILPARRSTGDALNERRKVLIDLSTSMASASAFKGGVPDRQWLEQDLGSVIDSLELEDIQRHFLRSRWLDQVLWMEGRADHARRRYYVLRLLAALGAVVVPTLVSLDARGTTGDVLRVLTIVLSLLVAMSVALEELIRFGERYRHYRRTVELLKSEGWQFFQLAGPYGGKASHHEAYPPFAARVEGIIQPSVEVYVKEGVSEPKEEKGYGIDAG